MVSLGFYGNPATKALTAFAAVQPGELHFDFVSHRVESNQVGRPWAEKIISFLIVLGKI